MRDHLKWMLAGVGALLVTKYLIFGLDRWNQLLHPGRIEDRDSRFLKGIFD